MGRPSLQGRTAAESPGRSTLERRGRVQRRYLGRRHPWTPPAHLQFIAAPGRGSGGSGKDPNGGPLLRDRSPSKHRANRLCLPGPPRRATAESGCGGGAPLDGGDVQAKGN